MELFFTILILILTIINTAILLARNSQIRPIKRQSTKILVDTSALIDGRILNIAKTGFLMNELVIPRSVLKELQLLADNKDSEKRIRARNGLDIANELNHVTKTIIMNDNSEEGPVDELLLTYAKAENADILTLDYNLIKRANAEKIKTLNINQLELSLRNEYLIGEKTIVKISEKGSNKNQGIAHLPDGTMIVVEDADKNIGESVEIEFTKFHNTSAGKMIFAKISKQ